MSLTHELDSTAEALRCGMLASRLSALLNRPEGVTFSEEDRNTIEAGISCLRDLLSGAQTLSSGRLAGGVTAQSIRSLGLALIPLKILSGSGIPSDETVIRLLARMERALSELLKEESMPRATEELVLAKRFFAFIADELLASLHRARLPRPDSISL